MYARLWWKDARQFWAIWALLVLAAAAAQVLLLRYGDATWVRQGLLGGVALGITWLYALVVGSAAFAGERETGTLRFLDTLTVSRWTLWGGKASFGLVSTVALGAVLLGMAAVSTERWQLVRGEGAVVATFAWFVALVLAPLGYGLLASAFFGTALAAAIASVFLASVSLVTAMAAIRVPEATAGAIFLYGVLPQAVPAALATLASAWWLTRLDRGFSRGRRRDVTARPAATRGELPIVATVREPRGYVRWAVIVLVRRTISNGFLGWLVLTAVCLGWPALIAVASAQFDPLVGILMCVIASVGTGVLAFHAETRDRTNRFLAHHGARPGVVWAVKAGLWSLGLVPILLGIGALAMFLRSTDRMTNEIGTFMVVVMPLGYPVGVLGGMAARRGVTAGLVSLLGTVALAAPLAALLSVRMIDPLGVLAVPAALLAVSWAWSGDWLYDRPAPWRWIRLTGLLSAAFVALFATYATHRVLSVPYVGPMVPPSSWGVPADRNAAGLYGEAVRALNPKGSPTVEGSKPQNYWEPSGPVPPEFLAQNAEALDLARRAAAMPDCLFGDPRAQTVFSRVDLNPYLGLARVVHASAADRQSRGDLSGSWDDILTVLRMARHFARGGTLAYAKLGLTVEERGLGLALKWAADRKQTPESLNAALAAYRALPPMPTVAEAIRGESQLVERTLDLPASEILERADESYGGSNREGNFWNQIGKDVATTPWEIARARRASRLISFLDALQASREPYQRQRLANLLPNLPQDAADYIWGEHYRQSTPLARLLGGNPWGVLNHNDRNEVGRRAFSIVAGLRLWALEHDGKYPEGLGVIGWGPAGAKPLDPFSGKDFGYVRTRTLMPGPLESAISEGRIYQHLPVGTEEVPVVYSVGPNRKDDLMGGSTLIDDFMFRLPPEKTRPE